MVTTFFFGLCIACLSGMLGYTFSWDDEEQRVYKGGRTACRCTLAENQARSFLVIACMYDADVKGFRPFSTGSLQKC